MKFVLFSDLHYCSEPPTHDKSAMERKLFNYAIPLVEKLKMEVNKVNPDALISLGDLIEDLKDHDKDIANIKYIWKEIRKDLPCPLYHAIGNHEMRTTSREDIEKTIGQKGTFSVDVNGVHLIFIAPQFLNVAGLSVDNDCGGILRNNTITKQELEWFENDLKLAKLPCIVFTHLGVAEDNMKGNWWFDGDNWSHALLENRKELKDILQKYKRKILAVFNGHQHWTKTHIENDITYYVLGSITENINSDNKPYAGYLIVEFENGQLKVTEKYLTI